MDHETLKEDYVHSEHEHPEEAPEHANKEHHEAHEHEHQEKRHHLRKLAFKHYSLPEFRSWAADVTAELSQQLCRLGTCKYDKEELVHSMLMCEDVCAMLRMLMHKEADYICDIEKEIYHDFIEMWKEHGVRVDADVEFSPPAEYRKRR